jgi:hypothetical protein
MAFGGASGVAGGIAGGSVGGAGIGAGASGGHSSSQPCTDPDADGDGITDQVEGYMASLPEYASDDDQDGTPNYLDLDSDGDGMSDADEAGPHESCLPGRDTDVDGIPDFRDFDSDSDRVSDADEVLHGLDPHSADGDGDGCLDLREFTFGRCDDSDLLLGDECAGVSSGVTKVTVSGDIPAGLADVSAVVAESEDPMRPPLWVQVVGIEPPSAGSISNGLLTSVNPKAVVELELVPEFFPLTGTYTYRYDVALSSASEGVIASAGVLWMFDICN